MNKVRCADVTCSAVSSMSTSELHEPVYAPHTLLVLFYNSAAADGNGQWLTALKTAAEKR